MRILRISTETRSTRPDIITCKLHHKVFAEMISVRSQASFLYRMNYTVLIIMPNSIFSRNSYGGSNRALLVIKLSTRVVWSIDKLRCNQTQVKIIGLISWLHWKKDCQSSILTIFSLYIILYARSTSKPIICIYDLVVLR